MAIKIVNLKDGKAIIIRNNMSLFSDNDFNDDFDDEFQLDLDDEDSDYQGTDGNVNKSPYRDVNSNLNQIDTGQYRYSDNFDSDGTDINDFDDDEELNYIKDFSGKAPEDDMNFVSLDNLKSFLNDPENEEKDEMNSSDDLDEQPEEDNDFQGLIRTVKGAALVYKRKNEAGTYDELWIYNVGDNINSETKIRQAILAGTDVNSDTQTSDDGEQKANVITLGNVQFIHLTNLPQ